MTMSLDRVVIGGGYTKGVVLGVPAVRGSAIAIANSTINVQTHGVYLGNLMGLGVGTLFLLQRKQFEHW